ncbi:TOMM precursor leader peptide-binding protein [Micromonospora musae]|uniref:YcaO domain-containing protein n=1 Tax=Micromonospora musae TaxID=1894970 RepID=A0A3A9Y8G4_9ACTN|nr:TOMM precursor leader peptide-binding protein [Micromonospora musae]RKN33910.1 hypothetical protein D7044_09380 [Micromonospora musae]
MGTDTDRPNLGPGFAADAADEWLTALAPLLAVDATVTLDRGFDLNWQTGQWRRSAADGREHLSVRVYDDEVQIGPRWVPGTDAGCPVCAESRERSVLEHPLQARLDLNRWRTGTGDPLLPDLLAAAARNLADVPLAPGELAVVGPAGVRRHRIPRHFYCSSCAPRFHPDLDWRPELLTLRSHPAAPGDPTRAADGARLVVPGALRDRVVDERFGPVQKIILESAAPFAMSMSIMPDAPAWGHGRAMNFREAEPVGLIELYERLGGFPFDAPVLQGLTYRQVADHALDPATLGGHTDEQLAHPTARVLPVHPDSPMDWVWGHDLSTGRPVLVPAEIGFYQYEYRYKLNRRAARAARRANPRENRKHFYDSSSGCAAGSCLEEAALHSLLELAERDAFLIAWHRATPLPVIPTSTITDPDSKALIDLIHARGFDVHILVATQDVALPIVWTLAVNRTGGFPATFHSGGSGANPATAIRGALREVAQLVTDPQDPDTSDIEPMLADPWNMEELVHHPRYYMHPATLARATAVLGGPETTIAEAFGDWPGQLERAAAGDVRGALDHVRELYAAAGMDRMVLVDQSTREHRDVGISVVKMVVPGILPMCFGHAQQRLLGQPRLAAALAGTAQAGRPLPYDPHPFP